MTDGRSALAVSLDLRIQYILAEELAAGIADFNGIGGAGLVLDARSGEILAMASLPTFAPDRPADSGSEARFNRASLGVYEMGSLFKIFTTAMVLDTRSVGLNDSFDVSEPIRVAGFSIRDFKPKKRSLSVPEIFIYSSNIGTVQMAMTAGTPKSKSPITMPYVNLCMPSPDASLCNQKAARFLDDSNRAKITTPFSTRLD